jgi:diguanylate cyclase (GGDEF)-like protein
MAAIQRSHDVSKRAVVAFVEAGLLRDVNDTFGADLGDEVLRAFGARLSTIDLPGTQVIRYGGAEFVVLFEQIAQAEDVDAIAAFLVEMMSAPFVLGNAQITVAPYVGAAVSADNYQDFDDLIHDAQNALARARTEGPGGYEVHDESKRGRYETRIDESRLHKAFDEQEFVLTYEPIVRVADGHIMGMEAGLRWTAPNATNAGLLMPHDFVDLLEKSGLMVRVGHWVIQEACRQVSHWNQRFPDREPLVVLCPIGARQLAARDLADQVFAAVADSRISPHQLCLVLTDEALRLHSGSSWTVLRRLKEAHIRLGVAGFGAGAVAVSCLRDFTLDIAQLSPAFTSGVAVSVEDQTIVRHLTALLNDMRVGPVAVGVQSAEQLAALRTAGIAIAQGPLFGHPRLPDAIDRQLQDSKS